jgi:hypothetical protein
LRKEKVELQKAKEQDLQMLCRNRKASNKNQSLKKGLKSSSFSNDCHI